MAKNKKGKQKAAPPTPQNEPEGGLDPNLGTIPEDSQEYGAWGNDQNAGDWSTAPTPWGGGEGEDEEEEEEDEDDGWDRHGEAQGYDSAQRGYGAAAYGSAQGGYPGSQPGYAEGQGGFAGAQGGYPATQGGYAPAQPQQRGYPSGGRGGYAAAQPAYGGGGRGAHDPAGRGWDARATPPSGPAAFEGWGAWAPDGATAPAAPPPAPAQTPRVRAQDLGGGGASWQSWVLEASANGFKPPPMGPPATGQPFHHSRNPNPGGRVAFAKANTVIPQSRPDSASTQALQADLRTLFRGQGVPPQEPPPPPQQQQHRKKSKRRKHAQEEQSWGRGPSSEWDEDWEDLGKAEEYPAAGQWGQAGDQATGGWDDQTGRQQYAEHLAGVYVPTATGPSPYPMPSRTMAYASNNSPDMLDALRPGLSHMKNGMDEYADLGFVDSYGEGLRDAEKALFGRERKAKDRIHWKFPHDKDQRVRSVLEWIQNVSHGLGAYGLDKFLQTRERGALFVNASYDPPGGGVEPAFDWLTYDDARETRDRIIQESVGFYDPAMQVVVFVMLPSKTGNSIAMWRRKITVPNSVRLAHLHEIQLAKAALRKEYPVYVDELVDPTPPPVPSKPPKKKKRGFFRRLFSLFRIEW